MSDPIPDFDVSSDELYVLSNGSYNPVVEGMMRPVDFTPTRCIIIDNAQAINPAKKRLADILGISEDEIVVNSLINANHSPQTSEDAQE